MICLSEARTDRWDALPHGPRRPWSKTVTSASDASAAAVQLPDMPPPTMAILATILEDCEKRALVLRYPKSITIKEAWRCRMFAGKMKEDELSFFVKSWPPDRRSFSMEEVGTSNTSGFQSVFDATGNIEEVNGRKQLFLCHYKRTQVRYLWCDSRSICTYVLFHCCTTELSQSFEAILQYFNWGASLIILRSTSYNVQPEATVNVAAAIYALTLHQKTQISRSPVKVGIINDFLFLQWNFKKNSIKRLQISKH